jgi:hypothetical protein
MFKLLCCLLLVHYSHAQPVLPSIEGYWRGAVSRDGAVQLAEVLFTRQGDSLTAHYNLPDLGLYEEPALLSGVTDSGFSIKTFMGIFQVIINKAHDEITGINSNWKPVPLKFHIKRMIMPLPDYQKEEVAVTIADAVIKGSLCKPVSEKEFPLVIIVHGADNPSRTNWVYRYYAYLLVKYGYAVFMYDQRGCGASGGSKDADLNDHANDLVAIGKYFSAKASIDPRRIAIIGESRGGWVAPIAAARSSYFKTLVLIQGSPKSPVELEYDVIKTSLEASGFRQPQVDSAIDYARLYFRTVKDPALWGQLSTVRKRIGNTEWAAQLPTSDNPGDENMRWWKKNDVDPAPYLKNREASILAIYGDADIYVPAKDNAPLMKTYLGNTNKDYKVLTIAGLPHSLYFYQSLYGNAFSWPSQFWVWPKRSVVMDTAIVEWLKETL